MVSENNDFLFEILGDQLLEVHFLLILNLDFFPLKIRPNFGRSSAMSVHKIQKFNYLAHIQLILYLQVRFSTTHLTLTFFFQSLHYFLAVIKVLLLFLFQKCNNAYRETFGFAVVQASVQGLLGDLSGVHGKVKRDSGEFQRALGKNLCLCSYFYVYFRESL